MCNLYSITINQAAIIAHFRVINRLVGNLPPMPGVFPDYPAPVIREGEGGREILMMRWSMPPPRAGGFPDAPEPNPETEKKDVLWFALTEERPLFAFAGIWTMFNGDRGTKSKPIPGLHQVYGFPTTTANAVVQPIHAKAMPVILTTDEERDVWMCHRWLAGRHESGSLCEVHAVGRGNVCVAGLPAPKVT